MSDRTASWSGVVYLYNFLVQNKGPGPFAEETTAETMLPGDIVQLGRADGSFYHSPVVTANENGKIYVAAHTFDAYMRPLDSYIFDKVRYLHILGVRKYT